MGWLLLIGFIVGIYLLIKRSTPPGVNPVDARLEARNREWALFIARYRSVAKTKSEKALVERMLADIAKQGLPVPDSQAPAGLRVESTAQAATTENTNTIALHEPVATMPVTISSTTQIEKKPTDNVSLLLYFGAFLLVASAGLFVAFGSFDGSLRALIVLVVSLGLYGSGAWLVSNKPKLEQAGLTFAGIGMAIAPLTGLAFYNYVFDRSSGGLVWFATSILCASLYAHALIRLKRPLVSYLLIFSFLSLFQSGGSIIDAPVYYYGWVFAFVGILLSAVAQIRGIWPELARPSRDASVAFVPISVFISVLMVSSQGVGQLAVSLLLAAAYYGLEALRASGTDRLTYATIAHVPALLGIGLGAYALSDSLTAASAVIMGCSVLQAAAILSAPGSSTLWQNVASVAVVGQLVGIAVSPGRPGMVVLSSLVALVLGVVVWLHQRRIDAYWVASLLLLGLPIIVGQYLISPHLDGDMQLLAVAVVAVIQFVVYQSRQLFAGLDAALESSRSVFILTSAVTIAVSFWASPWVALFVLAALGCTYLALAEHDRLPTWASGAGLLMAIPLLRGTENTAAFLAMTIIGLCTNILLSLYYRQEAMRWISTLLWLLLPFSIDQYLSPDAWTATGYVYAYLIVCLVLTVSRAIARGTLFASWNVPLASYARSASQSYVAGYVLAGSLALLIALSSGERALFAVSVSVCTALLLLVASAVERRPDMFAVLPLFLQVTLWSVVRPDLGNRSTMLAFLLTSIAIAVMGYLFYVTARVKTAYAQHFADGSLIAALVAPAAVFVTAEQYWPMPLGAFIASLLVFHRAWKSEQSSREWAGGFVLISVYWCMYYFGVREFQAYTHVLVGLFAAYAYWRNQRGEAATSDTYVRSALVTATIPLALQALGGQAVYGLWLLLESVIIMLLGMALSKRYVTMWGLYVAVATVLYQLRNLGWAALTVLAVFIIGIAIYRLQKDGKNN